jgi:hypothetical protein
VNAAQAGRLHRLLLEASHPRTCPITGAEYTADEMADYGTPSVSIRGYERERIGAPEMMEVRLSTPSDSRDRELFLDPAGVLWVWSTVRIPREDCDCECGQPSAFLDSPPIAPEDCPRHATDERRGVRELDCFRRVTRIGWELATVPPITVPHRESITDGDQIIGAETVKVIGGGYSTWKYVIHEGDPIRDVLAGYRAERAAAKAAA